ncbi:GTP-binding protein [Coprinopsis sp. MPI-PUGE-AT-0042]|nr:GTP-binding protein [Coprinopsis sp. MPI-PUGE-AT-0042]
MPKIRKKTSNRVKLKDRVSIAKKVKETRRKRSKAAKKNVQWKSKTPKDPGIPNDFPYKDEILAEVAEERRRAAEEKERKKAEKRASRMGVQVEDLNDDVEMEDDTPIGKNKLDVGADAIAGLAARTMKGKLQSREREAELSEEDEEESDSDEEAPLLINRELSNFQSVLDASDVLLEVLDARDPLETRSTFLEDYAKEKGMKVMFVLNKIDTCPREAISSWLSHLRSEQVAAFPFKASSSFIPGAENGKGKSKTPANDSLGAESILACVGEWAKAKEGETPLTIAVAGITNVGKSALINSLAKRSALDVYTQATASRGPTTTELPQEITLESANGKTIRLIDTPGISFEYDPEDAHADQSRGRDILLRSRGRIDKLKDPSPPLAHVVPRCNHEDLMLLYNLPAFSKGDQTAFLSGVARSQQLVKKKGALDLANAARNVLRDWSTGKLARYAVPPTAAPATKESEQEWLRNLYADDEPILSSLTPRKELRKSGGLVRLSTGSVDSRRIDLSETWAALEESDSEDEGEEFGGVGMDFDGDGSEEDEDELEDDEDLEEDSDLEELGEEEEEEEAPPVVSKGKRKAQPQAVARPIKKVAFAATTTKASGKTQPSAAAAFAPPSALKKSMKQIPATSVTKPKPSTKAEAPKKVANKAASKLKDVHKAQDQNAYDFGKFFK